MTIISRYTDAVRPKLVTVAAVVFIALGPLTAGWGIIAVSGAGSMDAGNMLGPLGRAVVPIGALMLAVGALEIWTGVKVLSLSSPWRIVGLLLAAIMVVANVSGFFGGDDIVANLVGAGIGAFLIWVLVRHAPSFARSSRRERK